MLFVRRRGLAWLWGPRGTVRQLCGVPSGGTTPKDTQEPAPEAQALEDASASSRGTSSIRRNISAARAKFVDAGDSAPGHVKRHIEKHGIGKPGESASEEVASVHAAAGEADNQPDMRDATDEDQADSQENKIMNFEYVKEIPVRLQTLMAETGKLFSQGNYDEARDKAEAAAEIAIRKLGKAHPVTATALNNLAISMKSIGHYEAAEKAYDEALEAYELGLGPTHNNTLTVRSNRAILLRRLEKHEEALDELLAIVDHRQQVDGPGATSTALAMGKLAAAYRSSGKLEKAKTLLDKSLRVLRHNVGENDVGTAACMNDLALVFLDLQNFDKAEELCGKTIAVRATLLGEKHPETNRALSNMALIYARRDEFHNRQPPSTADSADSAP